MDLFEFNKIAGAVLFSLLVIFGTKTASNLIFTPHKPEKPGYEVEIAEGEAKPPAEVADKVEKAAPLAKLLAEASAEKGQKVAKKCAACHTFDKGGANKIGPNIYGIVGRALGSVDAFAYSGPLKAKGGTWDYNALDQFIANPKGFIKGTKMAFAGIKQPAQRADLILYLRQQGDNQPPLPELKAEAAAAAPKPAAEAPKAAMPEPKPAAE